jgi:glucosyl-3-phosphoglycerate synthase
MAGGHVLVPALRASAAPALLEVAHAVMSREGGTGHLLGVIEVPAGKPVDKTITVARRYRALLQRISALGRLERTGLGVQVRVAHNVSQGVREAAYENGSELIVLEWPGLNPARQRLLGRVLEDLVPDPPCDLLLVRTDPGRRRPSLDGQGVLVPLRGGPSASLALRAAAALAGSRSAPLTVMHVYRELAGGAGDEAHEFHALLAGVDETRVLEVESDSPSRAILSEARRHQAVVLGAYAEAPGSPALVGSALAHTVRRLPGTVIIAKSARAVPRRLGEVQPAVGRKQLSAVVDRWFAENTFHSREFKEVSRLVALKRQQGRRISLGLPTLNEAETIENIIVTLREELIERHPLLDEMVVIDSGSADGTVEIARSQGVPVVAHSDILPGQGSFQGKGEALWKSLHRLEGDLIVWCDTDIHNIHPQFVYGVVGPLLTDPRIGYVKGFYKRPLRFGGELETAGGGRVTELTARPVLNLYYPELSGLVQPLSGEYAARRELLEKIPFFTGYGVEIGHLIDILEGFGLNRIAQVDLGVRIHRNQDLLDLSKMAFAILHVAMKRLGDRHRIQLLEEANRSMKLIHYENDRFFLEVKETANDERPPIALLGEYRARRARLLAEREAALSRLG